MATEEAGRLDEAMKMAQDILMRLKGEGYAVQKNAIYSTKRVIPDRVNEIETTLEGACLLAYFKRADLTEKVMEALGGIDYFEELKTDVSVLELPYAKYFVPYKKTERKIPC